MINMEMVEKLKQYGDISYEDAKNALEQSGGDMLDAVIILEKQGKIKPPEGDGNYVAVVDKTEEHKTYQQSEVKASALFKQFWNWVCKVVKRGNRNQLDVYHHNEVVLSVPVTLLVVLACLCFWVLIPLMIIGLFFDFRYLFSGPDLGKDSVNNVAKSVADAAEDIKSKITKE